MDIKDATKILLGYKQNNRFYEDLLAKAIDTVLQENEKLKKQLIEQDIQNKKRYQMPEYVYKLHLKDKLQIDKMAEFIERFMIEDVNDLLREVCDKKGKKNCNLDCYADQYMDCVECIKDKFKEEK